MTAIDGGTVLVSLDADDIPEILLVQDTALPDTFAARLGRRFNVLYYRALMAGGLFFCVGVHAEGRLVGFITYSPDVKRALNQAFRSNLPAFAWAIAAGVLESPRLVTTIFRIARSMFMPATDADADSAVPAELVTIALMHEARGAGPIRSAAGGSVSHALFTHACEHLASQGITAVKVLCRPGEPIANKFVQSAGFRPRGLTRRFGVDANLYVRDLTALGSRA
jgi:hypothetical protein